MENWPIQQKKKNAVENFSITTTAFYKVCKLEENFWSHAYLIWSLKVLENLFTYHSMIFMYIYLFDKISDAHLCHLMDMCSRYTNLSFFISFIMQLGDNTKELFLLNHWR